MDEKVKKIIDQVVADMPRLRKKMIWEANPTAMATISAFLYANAGLEADPEKYAECKKYLKKHVNVFSEIRGISSVIVITKMSMQKDYAAYLDGVLEVYKKLRGKHKLTASPYMVLAAINIYEGGGTLKADENIEKLDDLYKKMKGDHFWLTGDEDRPMLGLIVSRDIDIDAVTEEINNCFTAAKSMSFSKEAVHSAAQILAFSGKPTEVKVKELKDTLECVKKAKVKGAKYQIIPALAALEMINKTPDEKASDIKEAFDYLKTQKGFKWFAGNTERTLYSVLAYAIGTMDEENTVMNTVVNTAVIEIIIEAIMIMIMVMISASNAASNSSSN